MNSIVLCMVLVLLLLEVVSAFRPIVNNQIRKVNGARSMTAVFDAIAGMALAAKLQTSTINPTALQSRSMSVAAAETKQGMYKEYTVDIKDDSALDKVQRNYKTAEETDDSKTKVFYNNYSYLFLTYYTYLLLVLGNFCCLSRWKFCYSYGPILLVCC